MKISFNKNTSDEYLLNRCRKDDSKAQTAIFQKYAPKMLGVCRRYVRDKEKSEDLMITAFMKAFEKLGQFKNNGSFEGWLRKITVNQCLGYLRKQHIDYLEVDIEEAYLSHPLQIENDYLETDDLLKMIQELPVGYRTVFNMYAIEGYSHQEIAEELGISIGTSKSQLSRGRAILQNGLKMIDEQVQAKNRKGFRSLIL